MVVCPFVLFLLAIVLSVPRFTYSDYPFGIFKLFLNLDPKNLQAKDDNSNVFWLKGFYINLKTDTRTHLSADNLVNLTVGPFS
jgi:hypothetical protein